MRYSDETIMFETNCCKRKARRNKLKDDILEIFYGMILGSIFSGIFILAMLF